MNKPTSASTASTKPRFSKAAVVAGLAVLLILGATAYSAPNVFAIFQAFPDDSGKIQSLPNNPTLNATNKFFDSSVGTNGQSCATCHQPDQGFTIHVANTNDLFTASQGLDPLFRPIDTANRPDAVVTTLDDRKNAYSLLLSLGVIRIGKTIPKTADFTIEPQNTPEFGPLPNLNDPQHPGAPGTLSVFRRPLVNTNMRFDSGVNWESRASLLNLDTVVKGVIQALLVDPSKPAPVDDPAADHQISLFMTGVYTDQVFDTAAGTDANGNCTFPKGVACGSGNTASDNARGGVVNLLALGLNPKAPCLFSVALPATTPPTLVPTPFTSPQCTPNVPGYDIFKAWEHQLGHAARTGRGDADAAEDKQFKAGRDAVARGEILFNTAVLHVPPDLQPQLGTTTTCTGCHATRNIGNNPDPTFVIRNGTDSVQILSDLATHDSRVQGLLDRVKMLPEYCLRPNTDTADFTSAPCGTHATDVKTTDPGRALVSGKLADVGKFKPPILRGLATRSPYFHAAAAENIQALVHFYNARFQIGLTEDQVNDLGAFLEDQ